MQHPDAGIRPITIHVSRCSTGRTALYFVLYCTVLYRAGDFMCITPQVLCLGPEGSPYVCLSLYLYPRGRRTVAESHCPGWPTRPGLQFNQPFTAGDRTGRGRYHPTGRGAVYSRHGWLGWRSERAGKDIARHIEVSQEGLPLSYSILVVI